MRGTCIGHVTVEVLAELMAMKNLVCAFHPSFHWVEFHILTWFGSKFHCNVEDNRIPYVLYQKVSQISRRNKKNFEVTIFARVFNSPIVDHFQ